jgi:hypothetical protein
MCGGSHLSSAGRRSTPRGFECAPNDLDRGARLTFSNLELMHGRDTDLLDFWQYEADPGPPAGGTSAGFFGGNADIIAMGTSRISVDVRDGLAAMSRNGFNPWAFHVIGEMLR